MKSPDRQGADSDLAGTRAVISAAERRPQLGERGDPRLVVGAFGVEQIDQLRRRLGDPVVRAAVGVSGPRDRRREGGVGIAAG